ncbi:MAG TPA: hypothetical protein VHM64_17745 [Candidatus Binatia bacterium]|nr:hypothetical protein [Candidatus Binatia bacterium]
MKTVTGIFNSRQAAENVLQELRQAGFTSGDISFLTPDTNKTDLNAVPTTDGEQPGMGPAIGGVVGGAVGLSGGMQIVAALSSVLVPGVGAVLAMGFAGAALTGIAGAIGGAKLGSVVEDSLTEGLPKDELYFYIDELKKGRSVIICRTDDEAKLESAKRILGSAAVSLDAARDQRGIGLGSAAINRKPDT